ncbi:3-((3aS,4S,7aS)-7a-methyl-1, 5-dioxo-octahydro-1H-inden-4-yl)propanoyl:CoA ligase [Frankia sp. AiPs1]|uniref:FadD3 family acyl-CoA ligase n=1 Tax=Frankia sp. AiPa1 TaxID=573492 RepID=UPI00202AFCF6|nr:FadD3 family acyl-CoA ligase [Frankia sp. AiPa1]MCL9760546.1 FadD3 family acyl-CoA ligase [Frankia sp. AiPa1]
MQGSWNTIPELVRSAGERFGSAEAVVDGAERITFAELAERVRRAAGALDAMGVRPGDRVGIWAPNSAQWIVAAFGVLTAGGVLVPVNTRWTAREAADVLTRSAAAAVLVSPGFLGRDYTAPPGIRAIDITSDALAGGRPLEREVDGDAVADILFTSGTTGRPKGVMMNHRQTLRLYDEWCDLADLRQGDRYLLVNPFFHTFGYKAGLVASLTRGATMLPMAVFDVDRVREVVARERVTMLPGPPTLYHSLLEGAGKHDLSSLRCAVTGSADIPVELIRRMKAELPFQSIMTGYGLTEAGTATASRPGDSFEDIATTVGTACDGVEVSIADDGEVLVRGYSVMQGYLDDPVATAEAIDADGWLRTGDTGTLDERGRLRIVGRKKDMFIVGGFNAYPAEIEGVLLEHPAIAQAAVIGVPDDRLGEVGRAFVVARAPLSASELTAWSKQRLAGYKVPRSVVFLEALPLNASGKVMKDRLR